MKTAITAGVLVAITLGFYLLCMNHVSINEVGIAYNSEDGSVAVQPPGWHITSPLVRETSIPTLPFRVQIPSEARIINQRIVRFRPEGAEAYIKEQGFEWLDSLEFKSIMLGYAYSGKQYPFLEVLQ